MQTIQKIIRKKFIIHTIIQRKCYIRWRIFIIVSNLKTYKFLIEV